MTSFQAKFYRFIMPLICSRRMNAEAMRSPARTNSVRRMRRRLKNYLAQEVEIKGQAVVTFSVPDVNPPLHIIYLHGGAYVWQGETIHWRYMKKLLDALKCKITYVDYPLAPEHTFRETFAMLQAGCDRLAETFPGDSFVLMGDSAGGGLALALAQKLALEKHPLQPEELFLLSPWLDLSMRNPEIPSVEKLEHILNTDALQAAASMYAGGSHLSDYLLSPIYGDVTGLGKITLFIGTHDILYPDCCLFKKKVLRAGGDISFHLYAGMQHVWMLFPMPEAEEAFEKIRDKLSQY